MHNAKTYRHKGMALIFTLFILALTAIIGFGIHALMTTEIQGAYLRYKNAKAYYYAKAGVAKALSALQTDYFWATSSSSKTNFDEGSYEVSVWADPSNPAKFLKKWKVVSTGVFGNTSRTLEAWLQMDSFAKYAYFSNNEKMYYSGSWVTIWFTTDDILLGPVHSNYFFSLHGNPKFSEIVTSSNITSYGPPSTYDPNYNVSTNTYSWGGANYNDPSRFYHPYNNYSVDFPEALSGSTLFACAGGQPYIELPDTSSYNSIISGSANYSRAGNTSVVFAGGGTAGAGTMTIKSPADITPQTYDITGNTIVYIEGNATVSGIVDRAVNVIATGDISIPANLVYENADDGNIDVLGLVSGGNIKVTKTTVGDITINAAMLALNTSFIVENWSSAPYKGVIHLRGSLIQENRGPVGTFNASTGNPVSGYTKDYQYDNRLLNFPPPNFPTTGKISIKSWTDLSALGSE